MTHRGSDCHLPPNEPIARALAQGFEERRAMRLKKGTMRLHVRTGASSFKVLMFLAECGRKLETVEVEDLHSLEFLQLNPFATVPVLEIGGSEPIAESLTICRFLDDRWGATGLFGKGVTEKVQVDQWERRAELNLFLPSVEYGHHTHPRFASTVRQQPAHARALAERAWDVLQVFELRLRQSPHLALDTFTMADLTAYFGLCAFEALGAFAIPERGALGCWRRAIAKRPCGLILSKTLGAGPPGTHEERAQAQGF